MPAELRHRLKIAAAENNRSLTAEIVSRLEGSFEMDSETPNNQLLIRKLEELTLFLEAIRDGDGISLTVQNKLPSGAHGRASVSVRKIPQKKAQRALEEDSKTQPPQTGFEIVEPRKKARK